MSILDVILPLIALTVGATTVHAILTALFNASANAADAERKRKTTDKEEP